MADDRDQQEANGGGDRVTGLSTRLSEALTSVGISVRRREAEIELLDKTLAATGDSTSAAAKMARDKLTRTRTDHAEELEIVLRAHKALEDASEDCAAVGDDLAATGTQLAEVRTQLQVAEQSADDLSSQLEEAKAATAARVGDLEQKLSDGQQALTAKTAEVTDGENLLASTNLTLADAESARDAKTAELEQANATLEETRKALEKTQATLATTSETLVEKSREAEELAALMGIMPEDAPSEAGPAVEAEPTPAAAEAPVEAAAEPAAAEPAPAEAPIEAAAEPAAAEAPVEAAAEPVAAEPVAAEPVAPGQEAAAEDVPSEEMPAPGADWGAAVDGAAAAPPTDAPTEVPPVTPAGGEQSAVDAELQAYLGGAVGGDAEPARGSDGVAMFQATRAIDEFHCSDPEEIKLAGALQLQAWQLPELAQLCGLDEGSVLQKLEQYIAAGLVERTQR